MKRSPVVILDFETTGMSPDAGDRITEVAALRIENGKVTERFVSLVNCGVRIPSFIAQLTGITQQMVNKAPRVSEVVPRLVEFIGNDALAAHNASFDERFLVAESGLLGLRANHAGLICSLKLSRRLLPGLPSYRLGAVAEAAGIRFSGKAHRAEADAEVTAKLLVHLCQHISDTYGIEEVDLDLLMAINKRAAAKVPAYLQKLTQLSC